MGEVRELDIRALPPEKHRPETILGAFDELLPGASLVVVNDHDAKPLLARFQEERAGRFDWFVLERGPELFRIEIRRRASDGPRQVTECLQTDHRRLDRLLEETEREAAAGELVGAAERFAAFRCGLGGHIDAEEQVLFPAFEQASGLVSGPTMVMRSEHREIRRLMDEVARALDERDEDAVAPALSDLVELLGLHNQKEERMLYPMTDRAMGDGSDALVRSIQTTM